MFLERPSSPLFKEHRSLRKKMGDITSRFCIPHFSKMKIFARNRISHSGYTKRNERILSSFFSLSSSFNPFSSPYAKPIASAVSVTDFNFTTGHTGEGGCCKKYVVLCCLCGGLSAAVGSLFLAVHAVLSAHTASLALFETVPSYIPGIMVRGQRSKRVHPTSSPPLFLYLPRIQIVTLISS